MSNAQKELKIAINGFGRIGRAAFKIAQQHKNIKVVAINDLANPLVLAHLLKYDTVYGVFPEDVSVEMDGTVYELHDYRGDREFYTKQAKANYIVLNGTTKTLVTSDPDPKNLPWKDLDVDVVLECTGRFVEDDSAKAHLEAGAKRVVVSAPTKGGTTEAFLIGANVDKYTGQGLISNASCTTNCVSPVVSLLHKNYKVLKASLTTVHAVTSGQNLVDGPPNSRKPDMRRARSAPWNMFPTSTGAAKATTQVIPDLKDKFDGLAVRVPVMTGSLSIITALIGNKVTATQINDMFVEASEDGFYSNALAVSYEPLVSSDIVGSTYSAIVDLNSTSVVDGDLVKVLAWYDNEWGYTNRLVEMAMVAGDSI